MGSGTDPSASGPGTGAIRTKAVGSGWLAGISDPFRRALKQNGGKLSATATATAARPGGLLESIFQSITDGVIVADPKGRFVFYNKAAQSILGLGPIGANQAEWSKNYGCYLKDKVTPYPPERLPLARALGGEYVYDDEIYIRNEVRTSGAWISVNSSPLLDETGTVCGGVVVFRDITRRRESYEIVRHLSEAVEKTTDSVFITDLNGKIEYVNAAFEQTTGYTREEAVGRTPRILKSGQHDKAYYEGEFYHAEQTVTPVREAAGNLSRFVSVVKDVTELKKAKEREVEMRLALQVQQQLYPTCPPDLPKFDIYGAALPADVTCGDYYDFIEMSSDRLGLAIGDVRGHGFGSALLMVETRAYLRSLTRVSSDLGNIFRQLNHTLCEDTEDNTFVTLLLVDIDVLHRNLAYSSAGHIPGYVLDSSGTVRETLSATGLPLGLFPDRNFPRGQEIQLQDGDLVVLLTDGVTELQGPEEEYFGAQRALDVIRANRHLEARRIVECLHKTLKEFSGGQPSPDDITVVICKVLD